MSAYLSELNKLRHIQLNLENSVNDLNCIPKYDNELQLQEYFTNAEQQRQDYLETTHKKLQQIARFVELNAEVLRQNSHNINLKSFKHDMVQLQDDIQNMKIKLKCDIDVLENEEKEIVEEMERYNRKLEEWGKPSKYLTIHFKLNMVPPTITSSNKEVKELSDFLYKSKGRENGWAADDHQLFLKFKHKYKNVEDMVGHLHKLLPDISTDEIRKHDAWYKKYLFLKRKRDEALDNWRKSKKVDLGIELNVNQLEKPKNIHIVNSTCPDIKQKIAIWKSEKEAKRIREQQLKQQQQQQQLKELHLHKINLRKELKLSVDKWKQAKLLRIQTWENEKRLTEDLEKRNKAVEANRMIKQFRSQDDLYILKMRDHKRNTDKSTIIRSRSSQTVKRDPDRVLKPTKQWLQRTAKKDNLFENGAITASVCDIKGVPKLRVPEWRQNMKI